MVRFDILKEHLFIFQAQLEESMGTGQSLEPTPNNEMFDTDGDKIYSIIQELPDGLIAFKFFLEAGWGAGDPAQGWLIRKRILNFGN
ncbi:MAG: hypothetical protein IPF68_01150 [Bacteroidales bacterium]|nr:hypothetical protein [Bacteroidales bacterium]